MIKHVLIVIFLVTSLLSTAQKDRNKAYERMAKFVCECIDEKGEDLKNATQTQFEMAFGVCLFKAYNQDPNYYKNKGIKLNTDGNAMESLGEEIGMKMAVYCPEMLMSMAAFYTDDEDIEEEAEELLSINGFIESIENGTFHTLVVKGDDGRTYKILWLTYVNNHDLLLEAVTNKKTYTFTYYETEMYDNRINEYRNMLIMDAVEQQ
jgi:hypothetical protein